MTDPRRFAEFVDDLDDPLAPARGCLNGILAGCALWMIAVAAVIAIASWCR